MGNEKPKDDFMANVLKINNNGVFGKQMENVRNRVEIELVKSNEKRYIKVLSQPTFKRRTIFSENLVAVHKNKKEIKLDKPLINGLIILELSKYLMYDFYYNVLKKKYGNKIKVLFTDTDSLTVEVETEDIYVDMNNMKNYYDCSEYPKSHAIYSTKNQAVPGKFKDEMKGNIMTEFIGLRSKLYSFKYEDPYDENDHENVLIHLRDLFNEKSHKEKKVCKGIKRCVIENKLKTDDYNDVLINKKQLTRDMNLIKSKHHKVNTINVSKIALSCFDNKRHILDDGITSLAYGHYFLK